MSLSDNGTQYRAWFSLGTVAEATNAATLTVTRAAQAPSFTIQPFDEEVFAHEDVYFSATATGWPAPDIQWQTSTDGTTWANADNPPLPPSKVDNVTESWFAAEDVTAELFVRAIASNTSGSATSDVAQVTLEPPGPPEVYGPLGDQTVDSGDDATFEVRMIGVPDPSYQWFITPPGGQQYAVAGATGSILTLHDVTVALSGSVVSVIASNSYGDTDDSAILTVLPFGPVITQGPADSYPTGGTTDAWVTTFTAAAAGDPTPTVQWSWDDGSGFQPIHGATEPTLTMTSKAGVRVRAVFSVNGTTATTDIAEVMAPAAPTIGLVSPPTTVNSGQPASFTAVATGAPLPDIQWQRLDGGTWTDILGATGGTFSTQPLAWADSGLTVRAVASNVAGSAASDPATLAVQPILPSIVVPPQDAAVGSGDDAAFTVDVAGDPIPSVQWQSQAPGGTTWTDIPGATGTALTLQSVTTQLDGLQVRVVLSAPSIGTPIPSVAATLSVAGSAPILVLAPQDVSASSGTAVTFRVDALADPAPAFQWQQQDAAGTWVDIPGARGASYTSPPLDVGEGIRVRVVVSNAIGQIVSEAVTGTGVAATAPDATLVNTGSTLVHTGSNPLDAGIAGLLLALLGGVLVVASRRRRAM